MHWISLLLATTLLVTANASYYCAHKDVVGVWDLVESERTKKPEDTCYRVDDVVYRRTLNFQYPNLVTDDIGNLGTWTVVGNLGVDININQRAYYATFSYDGTSSQCLKLAVGYARDDTVRHWSCFTATKQGAQRVSPRVTIPEKQEPYLDEKFVNDHELVNRINKAQTSWTAKAYPQHEQYTIREMMQRGGGKKGPLPPTAPATAEQKARAAYLPKSVDWRNMSGVNYVSVVRDQQQCGSCYTYASTGMLEARLRILTNNERQDLFSTQDIVSCTDLSYGCSGGWPYLIGGRYAKEHGVVAEDCNPYTGTEERCDTPSTCARTYVDEYEYLGGYYGASNEELMMEELATNGPFSVGLYIYTDLYYYEGGIYHHEVRAPKEFDPYYEVSHVIILVGYGEDEVTGEKYWIAKNSWGDWWGIGGFMLIRRGVNEVGIESLSFVASPIP